jgi:hypothetical protein
LAKHDEHAPIDGAALERLMAGMRSADELERARAVRSVCPCRMGWDGFEQSRDLVKQLKKDPCPTVRAAALHVFEDADEMDSSGLPTSRQMVTNEMEAAKRRSRWRPDNNGDEAAQAANSGRAREWKQNRGDHRR